MNCQKHLFSIDPEVTYLNCAYMSPLMDSVVEAGIKGIKRKQHPWGVKGEDFFDESNELRNEFAKLINTPEPNRCVIIPSVSYGLANVANNLKLSEDDEILVVSEQFPSNVYPWRKIAEESRARIITITPPQTTENRTKLWNDYILNAITPKTKLVACAHIHWADGALFDLVSIREKTKEVGALLVVDGTQSLGALPFDVHRIKPDALIAAGYKSLMGPYSIGMAYYSEAFDSGTPIEENWINRYKSEDFANLVNYSDDYQPQALRYEVGEHSNFILVPMMLEALKILNSWGTESVKTYCDDLVREPITKLRKAGFVIEKEGARASNLFGIRLGAHHNMNEIKQKLVSFNIFVSYRGDAIRVSPNVYNDSKDLATLVQALTE
ncbi:MAG: aminotransferase class V-fold PLP-dependent enzyme [Balneolaceae bacterium]|nr:aminotransferase class V-fold PLP-dependent enzyme [Balneolaceae bacterium]MBO6546715.1 aminotransferase class V-fold PLP-dependent enzyme [Balneolaceae bacterium]MBO6649073.1 aminotransferase class V-fold PLP-dependent enzyme [Balneolaceae bacterium]